MTMSPDYFLMLGAVLFGIGMVGVLVRRNVLVILMSIELMLNSANLTLVTFSRYLGDLTGQVFALLVMVVAACEVAVGLAIIIALFRNKDTVDVDRINIMKW
jgi:NADH-quinone oxidoreductase subunit K